MTTYLMQRYKGLGAEERGVVWLLGVSLLAHIVVLAFSSKQWLNRSMPILQEWEIQADLFTGADFAAPEKSALPKAVEAEEAAIPKNLLPQLAKTVAIKDAAKEDETDAENGDLSRKTEKSPTEVENKSALTVKANNKDDANKIDQEEFLQRSALEKLRQEEKFSQKIQAEQRSALAKLRNDTATINEINSGTGGVSGSQVRAYQTRMLAHIRRCYQLPQAYNLEKANLMVQLAVVLSETGDVVSLRIQNPSGDTVFDEMAYKAVKDCTPMPAPPSAVAGKTWAFNFKP